MRKTLIGAALGIAAVAAIHRFGPRVEERAMAKCHEMMSAKSEAAPPPCACA